MFAGDEAQRERALMAQARRLRTDGVDYLQLREKDLNREDLVRLARRLRAELPHGTAPRLLLNAGGVLRRLSPGMPPPSAPGAPAPLPPDAERVAALVALVAACAADGLHLPGGWDAHSLRALRAATRTVSPAGGPLVLSVACHRLAEAHTAAQVRADLVLFSPVFAKPLGTSGEALPGTGLEALRAVVAAARPTPVLALGGVTPANLNLCLAAGAAGVAGIRLFLDGAPQPP